MAGPPVRERYNSRARKSVAGGSSHKKRKRPSSNHPKEHLDSVGEGHHDDEGAGGYAESSTMALQTQEIRKPLEGEGRGDMSAKKKKRLDSYIVRASPSPASCRKFKFDFEFDIDVARPTR